LQLIDLLTGALKKDPVFPRLLEGLERGEGPLVLRAAESVAAPLLGARAAPGGRGGGAGGGGPAGGRAKPQPWRRPSARRAC
jgi:hypothetical protein